MLLALEHRSSGPWHATEEHKPARWLRDTPVLQLDHPRLQIQVNKLTQLRRTEQEKCTACFQFVRNLPFRAVADPTSRTSHDVLRARSGDSHTKGVLFVAMLRCLGIPARLRVVSLGPGFLRGLLETDGRSVNHAIAEVCLGGRWMSVDAYCMDPRLGVAARARLRREGRTAGYGVHIDGQSTWDAQADAFALFSLADAASLPIEDFGVYDDPSQLAERGLCPRMNWAGRVKHSVSTVLLNRRIGALRKSGDAIPAGNSARAHVN